MNATGLKLPECEIAAAAAITIFYPGSTSRIDTVIAGDGIHVIGPRRCPTDDDAIGVLQSLRKGGAGADGSRNVLVVSTDCSLRGSGYWIALVDIDGIVAAIAIDARHSPQQEGVTRTRFQILESNRAARGAERLSRRTLTLLRRRKWAVGWELAGLVFIHFVGFASAAQVSNVFGVDLQCGGSGR